MARMICALFAPLLLAVWIEAQEPPKPDVPRIHRDAYEQPFDEARFRAFLEPVSGNSRTSLPSPKSEIGKKRAETGARKPRPKD